MTQLHTHTSIYTWLAEFSNYAKLCTFCRIELHSSKSFFSTRGINRSHMCRGRACTLSIPHKMLITAGHGRRPAMRVSERVCPTADLIPAMDCSKKSFSHYDWSTFKLQTIPLANLGGKKLPTWFWPFNFELMSHGGSKARPLTRVVFNFDNNDLALTREFGILS